MTEPTSTPGQLPEPQAPQSRQLLILSIAGGAVLLLAAIAIIVILGLRGTENPSDVTPTPTEQIVEPTPTAPQSPLPTTMCETIISSGDVEVSIALPISLTVRDATFPVEPIVPENEAWDYPADRSGKAVWVCGTVINYVIGLEPTAANETLVTDLAPGDEIRLQLSSGTVLLFRFGGRGEVPAGDESSLTQKQPRVTLVLAQDETWQTATAEYVAEAESMEPSPSDLSGQLGQPVQVGNARVTVNKGHVRRSDEVPPDTMYYLVEFSVANEGQDALRVDGFSMKLNDSVGNTYLLSPPASEAGELGPLSGEIAPGASAQGSAGYLVPDPLPRGPLIWTFSLRAGSGAQASVNIPYEEGAEEEPAVARADASVTDAFFSNDGNTLILEGQIRNTGARLLAIKEEEISLTSSAGFGELVSAAPPLPWEIEPGQVQIIELQYERPDASTVLLEFLGYSFEIGGLQ